LGPDGADLIPAGVARGVLRYDDLKMKAGPCKYEVFAIPAQRWGGRSFYSDETLVIRYSAVPAPATRSSQELW
jgi:hypothetical protein